MADEIALCNVIRLEKVGHVWRATIGPDGVIGLRATGNSPGHAVAELTHRCHTLGWPWDESWRDPAHDPFRTMSTRPGAAPTAPGGAHPA